VRLQHALRPAIPYEGGTELPKSNGRGASSTRSESTDWSAGQATMRGRGELGSRHDKTGATGESHARRPIPSISVKKVDPTQVASVKPGAHGTDQIPPCMDPSSPPQPTQVAARATAGTENASSSSSHDQGER